MCTEDDKKKNGRATEEAILTSQRSDRTMLVFFLGLMISAVASAVIFLLREDYGQDLFPQFPQVTLTQCVSLCCVSFVTLILFAFHLKLQLSLVNLKMPVVPTPLPLLGLAIAFVLQTPWECLKQWHERLGSDFFGFTLLGRTFVSISDPAYLRLVLQSKISAVKKDVHFTYAPFMVILGRGIVTSENLEWRKQRLKMSTALRIHVLDIIPQVTLKAVQRFQTTLDAAAETKEPVDLVESLRHLTLQVISNTFLSISAEESDSTFGKLYLPIVEECNQRVWHPYRAFLFFLPFWWKHIYRVHQLNSYVSNLIQTRWQERQHTSSCKNNDILDLVLDAYENDNNHHQQQQESLPRHAISQIRDEFKTFMLAGHETSASMMTWALYELMANQSLAHQVTTEGQAVFGKHQDWSSSTYSLPPRDELANLELAEACLKESLRKYSVVPLVIRRVVSDLVLDENYTIPKNSKLALHFQALHHNPKYWPNPMTFDPHRFLSPSNNIEPYTFLPFLEGPRNCLGQHLALLESKIVLGLLLQRYSFDDASQQQLYTELDGSPNDPRHMYLIPVTPKRKVLVIPVRRACVEIQVK